jgi:hypothetical protein
MHQLYLTIVADSPPVVIALAPQPHNELGSIGRRPAFDVQGVLEAICEVNPAKRNDNQRVKETRKMDG